MTLVEAERGTTGLHGRVGIVWVSLVEARDSMRKESLNDCCRVCDNGMRLLPARYAYIMFSLLLDLGFVDVCTSCTLSMAAALIFHPYCRCHKLYDYEIDTLLMDRRTFPATSKTMVQRSHLRLKLLVQVGAGQ